MKDLFSNLFLAYRAEHIKLKGTAFYIVSAIFGAVAPILYFTIMVFAPDIPREGSPYNYYLSTFHQVLTPYVNFFLPLLIVIMVSRITQFDHKNGGWQLMETQPLRKTSIYLSKYFVLLTACILSITALVVFSFLFTWIMSLVKEAPKSAVMSFEGLALFKLCTRLFVASLFLVAFQYFISVLIPSFIWSILIGFAGLLTFLFLLGLQISWDWFPFEILGRVSRYNEGSELGHWFLYTEVVSVLFTIIILYLGFQWYSYKKLKLAFLRSKQALLTTGLMVIVFGSIIFYLLRPNVMEFHNQTVISGKIDSDEKINTVFVKGSVDTLIAIPVQDNAFRAAIPGKLLFDQYTLVFDRAFQWQIFIGERDSAFLDVEYFGNQPSVKVMGTRLAENQTSERGPGDFGSVIPYWIEHNIYLDNPDVISDRIHKDWKKEMEKKSKFKTADNYVSKDDFIDKNKKSTTIIFLTYWNNYQKKRAALYDTAGSKTPEKIQQIKNQISLRDESMLSDSEYLKFILNDLVAGNDEDIDLNTKYLNAIAKIEKGSFKDRLLFWSLNKGIVEASNDMEISAIMGYADQFENPKFAQITKANAKLRSALSRGKAAPSFEGSTVGNQTISLKDLEGKLAVIDVWATWCGPCWQQAPYYEKLALKYKNNAIQFISLSTDRKKESWLIEAKDKSKTIMQLHANDVEDLAGKYDIQTIPRFILIDAAGNILNSAMPYPSESAFEIILRKELGLRDE